MRLPGKGLKNVDGVGKGNSLQAQVGGRGRKTVRSRKDQGKRGKSFLVFPLILLGAGLFTIWYWGVPRWQEFREEPIVRDAFVPGENMIVALGEGIALPMIWLDSGTFTMGSPLEEQGRWSDEGPQTRVRITRGFWIGKYPVTQEQWEAVMGNNPSRFTDRGPQAPVDYVSWEEAMRFGRILTNRYQSEERLPEGYIFTLPSEAQWEYACRAGTQTRFNTGDNIWNLEQAGWYRANSRGRTHPVGLKKPNEWGLYDMHGNVREWTRSWLGRYPGGVVSDFTGPAGGLLRVNRGGSWSITGQFCRSAYRHGNKPSFRYNNLGFRLALIPAF